MTDLERIIADVEYYCKNPEIAPLHYYGDATARIPKQLMLDAIALLKAQEAKLPVVDAVPVTWLKAHSREYCEDWGEEPVTVENALAMWQKEQEAR